MAKTLQGWERLQRRLKAIPEAVRKAAVLELERQAADMVETMQSLAPVADGDLRDSIVATPAGRSTPPYSQPGGATVVPELSVLITAGNSEVRYPHLVEFGTKSHEIKAKMAPALRLHGGRFAESVQHPGAAAHPFFFPGYRMSKQKTARAVKRAMAKAIKESKRVN
ncbi:HK97 gp10 family phage protein [Shinella fusca]|uniref:HK97 gp10 family phage protein n=1 Tax=Shinella fusca TaxID=544480 RepID=A0A7W8DVH4_9HYPH|nr:HK97 gp10 family phage protein [Shinella fusca]MBB5044029.1 HK97 gp10 family phage protein [Shinella fusca]